LSEEKNAHDVVGGVELLDWGVEVKWELKLMESRMNRGWRCRGRAGAVTGIGLEFVLVMEFAQVEVVIRLGLQAVVVKLGCRSGFVNSWFLFFDGVSLPTTSR
jgi:hypothetical protein